MTGKPASRAEWSSWEAHLAGDGPEDLAEAFTHVRSGDPEIARDRRTRMFGDLALHLLYENTIELDREGPVECVGSSWPPIGGNALERHAAAVMSDPEAAAALTAARWSETWETRDAFMQDVLAYLFRPGPYVRRIRSVQSRLVGMMASRPPLGPFVREAVGLEIKSNLDDPVVALQTSVQAVFPSHADVRRYLHRLDGDPLRLWARLYAVVFPAYGLEPRTGRTWFDLAYLFTTVADGVLLRARSHGAPERLRDGVDVLSAVVLGMVPDLFGVAPANVENLPLRTLPDTSVDWLDPHEWEAADQ